MKEHNFVRRRIVLSSSGSALIIRQHIEQIRSLEPSIAVFDAEIARLLAGFDTQLTTITGIGPTFSAIQQAHASL